MKCIRTETGRWVETKQGLIPLPGACHPAVVDVADSVRSSPGHSVRVVLPRLPIADPEEFRVQLREVVFSRSLAYFPDRWGIWTWKTWIDGFGRMLAAYEVSWVQREVWQPEFALAPFVVAPSPHP